MNMNVINGQEKIVCRLFEKRTISSYVVLMTLLYEHARSHPHVAGDERVSLYVSTPHMIHIKTLIFCLGQDRSTQVHMYMYMYMYIYICTCTCIWASMYRRNWKLLFLLLPSSWAPTWIPISCKNTAHSEICKQFFKVKHRKILPTTCKCCFPRYIIFLFLLLQSISLRCCLLVKRKGLTLLFHSMNWYKIIILRKKNDFNFKQ